MRCIMAGMDQKYSYVGVAWWICAWCVPQQGLEVQKTAGSPQLHFYNTVVDISFVVQRLIPVIVATMEIPQWCVDKVIDVPVGGSMVQKLWLSRSCSSSKIVDFLFMPQRQLPMVPPFRKTIEFLHLQYVDWWSMPLSCRSFSMPVVVRQARMVQTLLYSVEVPQLLFLHGHGRPCDPAATLGCDSPVPQTQFIAGVCGHSSSQRWLVRVWRR